MRALRKEVFWNLKPSAGLLISGFAQAHDQLPNQAANSFQLLPSVDALANQTRGCRSGRRGVSARQQWHQCNCQHARVSFSRLFRMLPEKPAQASLLPSFFSCNRFCESPVGRPRTGLLLVE